MALGDHDPLTPFLEGPATILGTILFYGVSAFAGQLFYYIICGMVGYFSGDLILEPIEGSEGLIMTLLSIPVLPVFASMTGIGFFFFLVDVVCVFRRLYTDIPWPTFFFRISGAQIGCFLSMWIVFEERREPTLNLIAFGTSFAIWGLLYWLVVKWRRSVESTL